MFTDEAGTIAAANPIVADGNGFWPQRYVNAPARAVVTDADLATLYTLDPVPVSQSSASSANLIGYTPSVNIPDTNVQDAIETVDTNARTREAAISAASQPVDADLTAIAALSGTGLLAHTGAGTYAERTITSSGGSVTVTNPGGVAGNINLEAANPIKAWANFGTNQDAGTYSRTGTTVTVNMVAHGMTTGQRVLLDFTTGTATDGFYTVTVTDADNFTVTDAASGATSGDVTRQVWLRGGLNIASISRTGVGDVTLTFTTPISDSNYAVAAWSQQNGTGGFAYVVAANPTDAYSTTQVRVRVRRSDNGGAVEANIVGITIVR